jgi:hypothetical protein
VKSILLKRGAPGHLTIEARSCAYYIGLKGYLEQAGSTDASLASRFDCFNSSQITKQFEEVAAQI